MPKKQGRQPGRRKLHANESAKDLIIAVVDHVLRTILTLKITYKLVVYFVVITFISVVTSLQRPSPSYFSDKKNPLNQYFAKFAWGWTLSGVITLLLLTNLIEHKGNPQGLKWPLARVAILTGYWYTCTHTFEWLENISGWCSNNLVNTKSACIRDGFNWMGFDISGHIFILVLCNTMINEESQVLYKISKLLDGVERKNRSASSPNEQASHELFLYRVILRVVMIYLVFLSALWDLMLLVTVFYFHTVAQKISGYVIAVIGWLVVYKGLKLNETYNK